MEVGYRALHFYGQLTGDARLARWRAGGPGWGAGNARRCRMQDWSDRLLPPVQALQHSGIVGSETQDLAESFIERAIGAVAVHTVSHH